MSRNDGKDDNSIWKVLATSVLIIVVVGLTVRCLSRIDGWSGPETEAEEPSTGRTADPEVTPEEVFARRMARAEMLLAKPPAGWTAEERLAESNLYAWVKQTSGRKLPWHYDDDDFTNQYKQVCKTWDDLLERRADELGTIVTEREESLWISRAEEDWAIRDHSFSTNEYARLEPLRKEVAYPLVNVTTNALVRLRGYRKAFRYSPDFLGVSRTEVFSGHCVFTNGHQIVDFLTRMAADCEEKEARVQRRREEVHSCSNRLLEARGFLADAQANLEQAENIWKDAPSQDARAMSDALRKWLIKGILILDK